MYVSRCDTALPVPAPGRYLFVLHSNVEKSRVLIKECDVKREQSKLCVNLVSA